MKNQHGFIPIIVLLVIVLVGATGTAIAYKENLIKIPSNSNSQPTPSPQVTDTPASTGEPVNSTTKPNAKSPSPTPATNNSSSTVNNSSSSTTSNSTFSSTTSSDATVSTSSVSLTVNQGETKSSIFSFISNGARSFSLQGYPTTYGAGINLTPSSGGMVSGTKIQVDLSVDSKVPTGTYTGTQKIIFDNTVTKSISFAITVTKPETSDLGFSFSKDSVNVTVKKNGSSVEALQITSTDSESFVFYGYPTSYGAGINISPSSGGISKGNTMTIYVNAVNVPAGVYTGTQEFRDGTTGAKKYIPFTVTVTD